MIGKARLPCESNDLPTLIFYFPGTEAIELNGEHDVPPRRYASLACFTLLLAGRARERLISSRLWRVAVVVLCVHNCFSPFLYLFETYWTND